VRGRIGRAPGPPLARQLNALNSAALAISGDLDLERVLTRILKTAASLARARYGALGVPDGRGGFGRFLTVGISEKRAALIGQLPRVHGVLGALVTRGKPIRVKDIRRHPLFSWYPEHHPEMREFLGVPIRHRGEILGNLFLSGSPTGGLTAQDQRLVLMLAAHAGVAISTARLYAKAQELAVLEERNRVARELHDAVSQTLFSMVYEAKAAGLRAAGDPSSIEVFKRLQDQASAALSEMRSLVFALRPKSLERDGLATTLSDHVDALRTAHRVPIDLRIEGTVGLPLDHELALLRIAQEALQNALKHGNGAPVSVLLREERAGTLLVIRDAGRGFDESALPRTARTMGLSTMRDRAYAIGADLEINARPDHGCVVSVFVPPLRGRQR
jgi:signal transduction histidine kinase